QRRARRVDSYVPQPQFGVGDDKRRDDEERRRRKVARDGVTPERAERVSPRDRNSFAGFGLRDFYRRPAFAHHHFGMIAGRSFFNTRRDTVGEQSRQQRA